MKCTQRCTLSVHLQRLNICPVCSHGYNHKGNFESDQNSHMEGKAYKCGKCNEWATNYLQDLKRHLCVCQVESNLKCPEPGCGGILKSQTYLDQHIKYVHWKGTPFICPM